MTHLGCYSCGFVETVANILLNAGEYDVDAEGLRCPICESPLHDVSPVQKLAPCWEEFINTLDLSGVEEA